MKRRGIYSIVALAVVTPCLVGGVFGAGCSQRDEARPLATVTRTASPYLAGTCDYSVLTAHNDNQRTGQQSCETTLTPHTVPYIQSYASRAFSNAPIIAQPLFVHGNRINDKVQDALIVVANAAPPAGSLPYTYAAGTPVLYVLSPVDLSIISQASLPPTNICGNEQTGCFGVLSTPVVDKAANVLYLVESTTSPTGHPEYDLMAYDLNTLNWIAGVTIAGNCAMPNGATGEAFSAYDLVGAWSPLPSNPNRVQQRQRPALLLDHGHVYVAFGSGNNETHTDYSNGWVFAYNTVVSGQNRLTAVGNPYCTTRSAPANGWGRAGIWQMGAGMAADNAGNIYGATGNGQIGDSTPGADTTRDDGQSFVQIAGAPWTGTLRAKFLSPGWNTFLAPNELEGSTAPVVLPGPNGSQRVLGATKMGLFTIMDPSTMGSPQGTFRGAWNQYGPILGDPTNLEPDAIACNDPHSCGANGLPVSSGGTQACCPNPNSCVCPHGHDADPNMPCGDYNHSCITKVHGSHPHIHGQPSYLANASGTGGTVFWWGEKDYPRFMNWDATRGLVTPVAGASRLVDDMLNRLSNDPSDLAPGAGVSANGNAAMPGGLTSLSFNGSSGSPVNAVLWANVPHDGGVPPSSQDLKAFDVSGGFPKKSIWQFNATSTFDYHGYPTVANGVVYVSTGQVLESFSNLPPPNPTWTAVSGGCARSVASGWVIGCDADIAAPNGRVYQWLPATGWRLPDANARGLAVSVDLNGTPWFVNSAGQVFKFDWTSSTFTQFQAASGFCATSVASGSVDTETWAIHCGDSLPYQWNGVTWQAWGTQPATKIAIFSKPDATCGAHLPAFIGPLSPNPAPALFHGQIANGPAGTCSVYSFATNAPFPNTYTGYDLTTDYLMGTDGNLYHWNGSSLDAPAYVQAPAASWGTNYRIAGWADGIYAALPNQANSMMVVRRK